MPNPEQRPGPRPFRFAPPPVGPSHAVLRSRLLEVMAERFDRRVTVVQAGAGFGKSTLLAQAIGQNALDPHGIDVWLGCVPEDESAAHLRDGLAMALEADRRGADRDPAPLVESVWARAPSDVALILDDVHLVPGGSSAAGFLDELIASLPANGHVVLASRLPVPVALARLRASGAAVVVDEDALAFDPLEVAEFAAERGIDASVLATAEGWPALVELRAESGSAVADDFLWEEVLAAVEPARRAAFVQLARFSVVDDELAQVVTGWTGPAREVVRGIPLTTIDGESARVHDLWRQSPVVSRAPDRGVRAGAVLLQERGQFREAFDVLDEMDDADGVADLVGRLAATDLPELHPDDFGYVLKRLPSAVLATAEGATLRANMFLGVDGEAAADALELAAARFRAVDDGQGEARVLSQMLFVRAWNSDRAAMQSVIERLVDLTEAGIAEARWAVDLSDAYAALVVGEVERAVTIVRSTGLREQRGFRAVAGLIEATAHLEVGRPDLARPEVATALPHASGRLRASLQALLLEADLLLDFPDEHLVRARMAELEALTRSYGVAEPMAMVLTGFALVAAQYGWIDEARRYLAEGRLVAAGVGRRIDGSLAVAEAALLLLDGDEKKASDILGDAFAARPEGPRPDRSYLWSLPAVYLLVPAAREVLDGLDVGPTWGLAREVGRALVALRERGDPAPAGGLPWAAPATIRAVTPAVLLIDLVTAAIAAGADEAAFDVVPIDARPRLRELAAGDLDDLSTTARRLLMTRAAPARERIEIRALGPIELWRGGAPVSEPAWGRERVRSLLQLLVDQRRMARSRAAATLWPDLDGEAAGNNLRVNLNHLQKLLQPDRAADEPTRYLRTVDDHLEWIDSDQLTIDVDEFTGLVAAARAADERQVPAEALASYLAALDLYRGDYLVDAPSVSWGEFERVRLRGVFVAAAVRAGDLLLAAGHHDEAVGLAGRAIEAEPFTEAAYRLQARGLREQGDRAGAWRTLSTAIALLRDEGLEPEGETVRQHDDLARPM